MTEEEQAERLGSLLEQLHGNPTEIFRKRDLWSLQSQWRQAFAPTQRTWGGDLGTLDWHIFSYDYATHVEGQAALDAYDALTDQEMFAAVSLDKGPAFRCRFASHPTSAQVRPAWSGDLYLVGISMRWTFTITHEEFCGPYFAWRSAADHDE